MVAGAGRPKFLAGRYRWSAVSKADFCAKQIVDNRMVPRHSSGALSGCSVKRLTRLQFWLEYSQNEIQHRLCSPSSSRPEPFTPMKEISLSEIKDRLSEYLRLAEEETIVITRHGKPAGVLVGFATEDDWFDYRLEHDERFLQRVTQARESLRAGHGIKLEEIDFEETGDRDSFPTEKVA